MKPHRLVGSLKHRTLESYASVFQCRRHAVSWLGIAHQEQQRSTEFASEDADGVVLNLGESRRS